MCALSWTTLLRCQASCRLEIHPFLEANDFFRETFGFFGSLRLGMNLDFCGPERDFFEITFFGFLFFVAFGFGCDFLFRGFDFDSRFRGFTLG